MTSLRLGLLALSIAALFAPCAVADEATQAKEHFKRGNTLFYLQRYTEAAAEYEKAYEAKDAPGLLFNIGQAYRLAGENQRAIGAYRSYLARVPAAPNRPEVLALIEDVKKTIEAHKRTKEKPPTGTLADQAGEREFTVENDPRLRPQVKRVEPAPPPPAIVAPPPPKPRLVDKHELAQGKTLRLAGAGAGAFGVASLVVGGVFAGLTAGINHDLNNPKAPAGGGLPTYSKSLESKGHTDQIVSISLLAVGGVAVVAGVTALLIGNHKVKRNTFALAPVVGPNLAGASFRFDF